MFPDLTQGMMKQYADLYFNTFNMVYPILDYGDFMQHIMPKILQEGFGDGCVESVTALSVFALGKLSLEGAFGEPISTVNGLPSGIRGGSSTRPPGLDIFNEARRRLGFVHCTCSLETAQVFLLLA